MKVDDDGLYRILGERLRHQRVQMNMTQTRLAEEAGLLRTAVTNIEAGRQRPPLHTLYKLAHVLRAEVSELLPEASEVVENLPVQLDRVGRIQEVPPRTAELVRRLREEGHEASPSH